ncbi:MAG TPA: hypothetical protein DCM07_32545 [Planctomycetaceae bacterium]|nr:hypothetical protein [Planctomycetaceae bacterium]
MKQDVSTPQECVDGKVRSELMFPFKIKAEAFIPFGGDTGISDAKDGNQLLRHEDVLYIKLCFTFAEVVKPSLLLVIKIYHGLSLLFIS